jgi:hypothetical protein
LRSTYSAMAKGGGINKRVDAFTESSLLLDQISSGMCAGGC